VKIYETLPDGSRVVRFSPMDWKVVEIATEIAFGEEENVPPELRETARELLVGFHSEPWGEASLHPDRRQLRSYEGPAIGPKLVKPAPAAGLDAEREHAQDVASRVIRLLPQELAGFVRGSDMAGTVNWSREGVPQVYATPNWEGLLHTPVAIGEDGPVGSLAFNSLDWSDDEDGGALEYCRLLTPILEKVAGSFEVTIDGDATVRLYPWPSGGCFLGVYQPGSERAVLFSCPMNADGSADRDNTCDVENVEGLYLDTVNAFFGTDFVESQFAPGR
jgi:hypothetical protein